MFKHRVRRGGYSCPPRRFITGRREQIRRSFGERLFKARRVRGPILETILWIHFPSKEVSHNAVHEVTAQNGY
jgi:hypothetical protein